MSRADDDGRWWWLNKWTEGSIAHRLRHPCDAEMDGESDRPLFQGKNVADIVGLSGEKEELTVAVELCLNERTDLDTFVLPAAGTALVITVVLGTAVLNTEVPCTAVLGQAVLGTAVLGPTVTGRGGLRRAVHGRAVLGIRACTKDGGKHMPLANASGRH